LSKPDVEDEGPTTTTKGKLLSIASNELYLKYGFISTGANDGSLKCIFHTTTLPMFWMKVVAVELVRPLHVSKVGQSKEKEKDQASDTYK